MRRLQDIDLKSLRVFKAIVEAGGLAGAQAVLNSSQSTLSTQLGDLEKRLGFRLCRRGRGGFALTQQGQRLLEALEDYLEFGDAVAHGAVQVRSVSLSGGQLLFYGSGVGTGDMAIVYDIATARIVAEISVK